MQLAAKCTKFVWREPIWLFEPSLAQNFDLVGHPRSKHGRNEFAAFRGTLMLRGLSFDHRQHRARSLQCSFDRYQFRKRDSPSPVADDLCLTGWHKSPRIKSLLRHREPRRMPCKRGNEWAGLVCRLADLFRNAILNHHREDATAPNCIVHRFAKPVSHEARRIHRQSGHWLVHGPGGTRPSFDGRLPPV
jgi:hypothetical protein